MSEAPTLIDDLRRTGPEPVGPPLRAVAVLAREVGLLLGPADDALARRRRRTAAGRAARAALSLAAAMHGALGDRPDAEGGWERALERLPGAGHDGCGHALSHVATLALLLPPVPSDEDWQAAVIAFADEGMVGELVTACVDLAAAALAAADA